MAVKHVKLGKRYRDTIHGIQGIVIIVGAQMAAWGDVRIVPLKHEKG